VTPEPGPLHGRTAIVTGAGRGLGRAIALAYAGAGARVIGTAARQGDELQAVAAEAESLPGTVVPLQADVTRPDDVDTVLERALAETGRVDILVNNAARGMRFVAPEFMTEPLRFWETDPDAWRMVIDTNVSGVYLMTRAVAAHMVEAGAGRIVNVSINRETMVRRGFSPYGPSKAALEAMTEVWAQDLDGTGVHINLLLPGGPTATGMIPDRVPDGIRERLLDPEVVVPGALHLALTDESGQRVVGTEFR
jgi:3-oxoacyl-[acyl-carrier protein] reductase